MAAEALGALFVPTEKVDPRAQEEHEEKQRIAKLFLVDVGQTILAIGRALFRE